MGASPRSLAAEANGCFMVGIQHGSNRIQGRGASVARDGGLPSDLLDVSNRSKRLSETEEVRRSQEARWLDNQIPIQATSVGKSIINLSSVATVGLDLAKHVFQVHGVDALGRVVVAKPIRRNKLLEFFASLPRCLVGLEASGSAHHWARELIKLGHDARMMPPAYVKPYIRRQKNDASDAAAICEAVTRPSMRFVGVRSLENQAALMRHKAREMLVSQRTQLLNGLRGHLTEIGVIAGSGAETRPRTG